MSNDITITVPEAVTSDDLPPGWKVGAHWSDPGRGESGWYLVGPTHAVRARFCRALTLARDDAEIDCGDWDHTMTHAELWRAMAGALGLEVGDLLPKAVRS